jgi:hypothetical protein
MMSDPPHEPPRYEGVPPVNWFALHPAIRGVTLHWWDAQGVRTIHVHRPEPLCPDCDHGIAGGQPCVTCGGSGYAAAEP